MEMIESTVVLLINSVSVQNTSNLKKRYTIKASPIAINDYQRQQNGIIPSID